MGFFDFVKDAGRKLGIGSDAPTPDELRAEVTKLGLEAKDFTIEVNDDVVTVSGTAPSQEQREKIVLALGNVHGVAKVDDRITVGGTASAEGSTTVMPTAAAAETAQSRFYTVKKGDTLSKVSKEFYGDPNKYQAIFEANRPMLEHPDKIYPGQVLRVP
ncbi:peptidoglycan-binding protein LysM [Skermanella stibiiresistens SB22]|uniref:Potassium binding protein Kbp n=1 Tax=Skermanella stibiiresistens SB22 TaxID=1385369 RepID=W9H4L3_9PROT|nr:peptidoglycan-binding protein LysM [Skermanella stibiiresistens]EWY39736.1 peptidoglycan-binding protein LysM [Skermanella stibiiresistens SB22]